MSSKAYPAKYCAQSELTGTVRRVIRISKPFGQKFMWTTPMLSGIPSESEILFTTKMAAQRCLHPATALQSQLHELKPENSFRAATAQRRRRGVCCL